MRIIPWSQIRSWRCIACGACCRNYDVVLKLPEWLNIVSSFGFKCTASSINNFLLKRRTNGSCVFLFEKGNKSICGLQYAKPQSCKLWPFKISDRPRYGVSHKAAYWYRNREFYIYADSACVGLNLGLPTQEFTYSVIPEFIEVALRARQQQCKTTALL